MYSEEMCHETAVYLIADVLIESLKNLQKAEQEIIESIKNRATEYLEVNTANDQTECPFRGGILTNGSLNLTTDFNLKSLETRNRVKMGISNTNTPTFSKAVLRQMYSLQQQEEHMIHVLHLTEEKDGNEKLEKKKEKKTGFLQKANNAFRRVFGCVSKQSVL